MTDSNKELNLNQGIPILVKISAIIIIVVSVIGLVFFASASIYGIYNNGFLKDNHIYITQYPHLNNYVIIQLVLHLSLMTSAIFLFLLRKIGYYLFVITLVTMIISELIFVNEHLLSHIIPGVVLGLILTIYYSRFK